jgi:hypothetical protein
MSAIIHPPFPSIHITYQLPRSTSLVNQSIASTAIIHESINAKNAKRQDSSQVSLMSETAETSEVAGVAEVAGIAFASVFPWIPTDI